MTFDEAMNALAAGQKVKLPEWIGHWFIDFEDRRLDKRIRVLDRDGNVLETPHLDDHRNRDDWEVTSGTRDFGGALIACKAGKKIARHGWAEQGLWVVFQKGYPQGIAINRNTADATGILEGTKCFFTPYLMLKKNAPMSNEPLFTPWVPSIGDILADDWYLPGITGEATKEEVAPMAPQYPMEINGINTDSKEGRMLVAALAMMTTENRTHMTPDDVLVDIVERTHHIYHEEKNAGSGN